MYNKKKISASLAIISVLLLSSLLFCAVKGSSGNAWSAYNVGNKTVDSILDDLPNQEVTVSGLVINEFMADNKITIAGPDGNSPDWIELYNAGNQTIDMSGMYLTDDLNDSTCWQFPEGTSLGQGEYMIVWADTDGGEQYVSFSLNANGEEIGLFASNGETLIDSVVFTKQLEDVSYGRVPDGGSTWDYLPTATPGSANRDSAGAKSSVWSILVVILLLVVVSASIVFIGKISTRMR